MPLTRRALLSSAMLLATTGQPRAHGGATLTATQVVERIRNQVGIPWRADTVDRIVAGTGDLPVSGIATTMMATLDVLRRAAAAGLNLVVAHEPTFWSHFDATDGLRDDPAYRAKRDFVAANRMAVFRFHDHWHAMAPDGIAVGMARALGWQRHAAPDRPDEFAFPDRTLAQIANHLAQRLDARSMRILGDPALVVRRAIASWGYADLDRLRASASRPDVDLVIVGETREWELVPYVDDQIAAGQRKALIVLNHVVSEQEGMRYCAQWLHGFLPGLPIEFVAAREPLRGVPHPSARPGSA